MESGGAKAEYPNLYEQSLYGGGVSPALRQGFVCASVAGFSLSHYTVCMYCSVKSDKSGTGGHNFRSSSNEINAVYRELSKVKCYPS